MAAFDLITLPTMRDERGHLTVLDKVLPFDICRSFWIYGADGNIRGGHRHHKTRQALVALKGSVTVHMDDGKNKETVILSQPHECLIVEPKDWHTMDFGPDSILMVFASHSYDKNDYIHDPYQVAE